MDSIRIPRVALLTVALFGLNSCVKEEDKIASLTSSGSTVTTAPPNLANKGLYMMLQSAYEQSAEVKTVIGTCSINFGAVAGSTQNCTFDIPEGQLYYSQLTFSAGTSDSTQCAFVTFDPYYYRGGTSAAYIPQWDLLALAAGTTVACNATPSASCYNGPAVHIVGDFPNRRGMITATSSGMDVEYDVVPSAWELNQLDNRFTASNVLVPGANVGAAGAPDQEYVANSLQNYRFECLNEYYETIYGINVTINSVPGPINHFPDWND